MTTFYKVVANGVARFIPTTNTREFSKFKKDFDGKIVVDDTGEPKVYTSDDINNIKVGKSKALTDDVSVKNIFKNDSVVAKK